MIVAKFARVNYYNLKNNGAKILRFQFEFRERIKSSWLQC